MRPKPSTVLLAAAALFTFAGGAVHLREWIDTYRNIPAAVDGAFVVRLGFPVNFATSVLAAVLLITLVRKAGRVGTLAALGIVGFQVASVGILIATRLGSVLGWSENIWTLGAKQSLALELGAIAMIGAALLVRQQDHLLLRLRTVTASARG